MAPIERDYRFNMMLSEDERRMLVWLAEQSGYDVSSYLRGLIRREYGAANSETRPERISPLAAKGRSVTRRYRDPAMAPRPVTPGGGKTKR